MKRILKLLAAATVAVLVALLWTDSFRGTTSPVTTYPDRDRRADSELRRLQDDGQVSVAIDDSFLARVEDVETHYQQRHLMLSSIDTPLSAKLAHTLRTYIADPSNEVDPIGPVLALKNDAMGKLFADTPSSWPSSVETLKAVALDDRHYVGVRDYSIQHLGHYSLALLTERAASSESGQSSLEREIEDFLWTTAGGEEWKLKGTALLALQRRYELDTEFPLQRFEELVLGIIGTPDASELALIPAIHAAQSLQLLSGQSDLKEIVRSRGSEEVRSVALASLVRLGGADSVGEFRDEPWAQFEHFSQFFAGSPKSN